VILKTVPYAAPARNVQWYQHWKKSTNESKGRKPEQKFDAAFGTIFILN
jgi:hypothetical protein